MRKRIIAAVVLVCMIIGMLPMNAIAATSTNPLTLTLVDESGNRIEGADVTAYAVRSSWGDGTQHELTCTEIGNGQYYVYRGSYNSRYYNITITADADGYEAKSSTLRGNNTSTAMTLESVGEQWVDFWMYYYLNGDAENPFPETYAGYGDPVNYGPSSNNIPFATLTIDINRLKELYPDDAIYQEGAHGNQWDFIPGTSDPNMADAEKFWDAVMDCASPESIAAFEATGLAPWFTGYVAKFDTGGDYHIDGYLEVLPPVYSIELYKDDTATGGDLHYVGGLLTAYDEEFKTVNDVLTKLEEYLGYTITWEQDANGVPVESTDSDGNICYTGTYISEKMLHTITVCKTNTAKATSLPEGSEISYEKKSDYYYIALYVLTIEEGKQVEFTVTYTDGDANGTAFSDHSYGVKVVDDGYPNVPAFTGVAVREGYDFLGWTLEGGDGTILSDAEAQAMIVDRDLVFHAEWKPIPLSFTGSVHVILNGSYDSTTGTASGTYIDIDTVTGAQAQLFVKEENSDEYIALTERADAVGIYEAVLQNGNYNIFLSTDGGNTFTQVDSQMLVIYNANRHRYLFYNTVQYDLNGGQAAEDFPLAYYQSGTPNVYVSSLVPTRDRYVFTHWVDQEGKTYTPGQLLTESIYQPYVLTAQWADAVDLYLNIQIIHDAADGQGQNNEAGKHDIDFVLSQKNGVPNYNYLYEGSLTWDGESEFTDAIFAASVESDPQKTVYNAVKPVSEDVLRYTNYGFNTNKPGYTLQSVSQTTKENGDIVINAVLIYDPNNFDFKYYVSLDEEAKKLPDSFKPVAANVKVTSWYNTPYDADYGLPEGDETYDWYTITQQRYTYQQIMLDENGEGSGSYPVWANITGTTDSYHYRIEVVSYIMPDGEIIQANNVDSANVTYLSDCGHIEANVEVTDGGSPDAATQLTGAYYVDNAQQGRVEAIISIHTYKVTFVPNGGVLNGTEDNTVVEPLYQIPDLSEYVPTRDGGYVFEGWYLADDSGNMTDQLGVSFTPLNSDVTLIAKWKAPRTIVANVVVERTYDVTHSNGEVSKHQIHESYLAPHAIVNLQKIDANGYAQTIQNINATLTYDELIGTGSVTFTGVPDDGYTYRILVMVPGYSFTYQHEPQSLDANLSIDYVGSYNATDFTAEYGNDTTAVINSYGNFDPLYFNLKYEVDADAIGEGFRPENAQILITFDDDSGIIDPSQWPVVSRMIYDDVLIGQDTPLVDGLGSGSYDVWATTLDGITLSEYGLRLQSTTFQGTEYVYEDADPFTVTYQAPTFYDATKGQTQMLIAVLTPKTYPITYVTNGGTMPLRYPAAHTWSFETDISGIVPTRAGYIFEGWYTDEAMTVAAPDVIDAAVHAETVLYAKWKQANDRVNLTVYIDHSQANDSSSSSGQAGVYDRLLKTQLASLPEGGNWDTYVAVPGTEYAFTGDFWHTTDDGTEVEVFTVNNIYSNLPSDVAYSAYASMEGYTVVTEKCSVTPSYNEDNDEGTVYDVEVYLEYCPELLEIDFTVRMDEDVNTYLDPASALVKVTSWYDVPDASVELGWHTITQHEETCVTVDLDPITRSGMGSYQVWQWYLEEEAIPFYYRIEVIGLILDDGTTVEMNPAVEDVSYTGGIYTATVYAENGAKVPIPQDETHSTTLTGAYGAYNGDNLEQVGTLEAVITAELPDYNVVFHSNNTDAQEDDIFRTYYPAGTELPEGNNYSLEDDFSVPVFYDIPTYAYDDHNGYIFKGWYMGTEEDAEPMDWSASYTEQTDIYAHWIYVGEVAKEDDGKIYDVANYSEYDLMGNQIRTASNNPNAHYGKAAPGLRFIASLSERVYAQMNSLHTNNSAGIEYGFVIASTKAATAAQQGDDYMLKYKHESANGEDTTSTYSYVQNAACRLPNVPVDDHYDGDNYRLYTAVITYEGLAGEELAAAQDTYFIGRAYLRYFDANGLERIHYNNYTGNSRTFGGVNTSYNVVNALVNGQ